MFAHHDDILAAMWVPCYDGRHFTVGINHTALALQQSNILWQHILSWSYLPLPAPTAGRRLPLSSVSNRIIAQHPTQLFASARPRTRTIVAAFIRAVLAEAPPSGAVLQFHPYLVEA